MSFRVTEAEVKEIAEVDPNITSLNPFITLANMIVDEKLIDSGLSEARLKEIERWLSAHFIKCARDPLTTSESAGVSASYLLGGGEGLKSTPYGQQAIILDTTGVLASLASGTPRFVFKHIGAFDDL